MDDVLYTYAHARAVTDLTLLRHIYSMAYGMELGRGIAAGAAHASAKSPPEPYYVSHKVMEWAGTVGINMAGETAKIIERHRPDIKEACPDFPWAPLKRLRNMFAHPSRDGLAGEDFALRMKRINKEYDQIFVSFNDDVSRRLPGEPLTATMLKGVNFNLMSLHLRKEFKGQVIPVVNHPSVTRLCEQFRITQEQFPQLVSTCFERAGLAGLADGIEHLSPYCAFGGGPLDLRNTAIILSARNMSAHCTEMLVHDDPEGKFVRPGSPLGVMTGLYPYLAKVKESLAATLPAYEDTAAEERFLTTTTQAYMERLTRGQTPEQRDLLRRATDFATASFPGDAHLQDAYLGAAGRLINNTRPETASAVMDYLKTNPKAFTSSKKNAALLQQSPPQIRHVLASFMEDFSYIASPLDAKLLPKRA